MPDRVESRFAVSALAAARPCGLHVLRSAEPRRLGWWLGQAVLAVALVDGILVFTAATTTCVTVRDDGIQWLRLSDGSIDDVLDLLLGVRGASTSLKRVKRDARSAIIAATATSDDSLLKTRAPVSSCPALNERLHKRNRLRTYRLELQAPRVSVVAPSGPVGRLASAEHGWLPRRARRRRGR